MTVQSTTKRASNRVRLLLLVIVLVAASLRFYNIDFGLPQLYHPDEPTVAISQRMFKTGDLNPHFFNYPTLFLYINAAAYVPYYEIGRMLGEFETPDDIAELEMLGLGTGLIRTPSVILLGRTLSALVGTLSVVLIYLTGKQLRDPTTGLLAALLLTFAPIHVMESHYITANVYVTFFALLVAWTSLNIYHRGLWRDYALAGIAVGLVMASKYNGAMTGLFVVIAHFLRNGWSGFKQPKIYVALLLIPITFVLVTPYAILDFETFWKDMRFEASHYSTGHAGMEGNALQWYLSYFWQSGGLIAPLALAASIFALYRRAWHVIIVAVFPLVYFVFISSFNVRNARTAMLAEPFFYLLVAWFLVELWQLLDQRAGKRALRIGRYAIIFFAALIILFPATRTARQLSNLTRIDSRETARVWIEENLPETSKVGIEAYSPYVDPKRFEVEAIIRANYYELDWFAENEFDFLILSQGMYNRYLDDPARYPAEVEQYNRLFNTFEQIKLFNDGDYEIQIYAVPE
jgi:4-amino-4-deoxy-L-arabinose transferase-like glycosyltransferase